MDAARSLCRTTFITCNGVMAVMAVGDKTQLKNLTGSHRKVPPGGKCSDLFSSSIQLAEPVNKPRKIDRY